jgi:hypothetical protein
MTPAEKIAAAIRRLEQLKADSTPGPWKASRSHPLHEGGYVGAPGLTDDSMFVAETSDFRQGGADADLIVTLHRAIDAQLTILKFAAEHPLITFAGGDSFDEHAILLADAILGESS